MWKDDDGSNFDKNVLEKFFPAHRSKRSQRREIWRAMDDHRNGYVSLAEFDKWFNVYTLRAERTRGEKSAVYLFAKHGLIRAFELANGIAPKRTGVSDAYVRDAHTIPTIAFLKKYTRHILSQRKKESLEDDSSFL